MASWPIRPDLDLLMCIVHPDHILSSSVPLNCVMQGLLPSKNSWLRIAANVTDELVKFDAIQSLLSHSYNTPTYNRFIWGHFQPQQNGKSRKKHSSKTWKIIKTIAARLVNSARRLIKLCNRSGVPLRIFKNVSKRTQKG